MSKTKTLNTEAFNNNKTRTTRRTIVFDLTLKTGKLDKKAFRLVLNTGINEIKFRMR